MPIPATPTAHRCLGIIPARGGSKEIPRKNIRLVGGKPLIAWSIEAARATPLLDHFVVTTDDDEIADVARQYGADVLMRPHELALDDTPMVPVVQHAFRSVEASSGQRFSIGVLLQPTAPQRTGADIEASLDLLIKSGADSVVSVYQVHNHHPARMYHLKDGRLLPFADEPQGRLRQDLPAVYHRNGAIYAFTRSLALAGETLIGPHACPYVMPYNRSISIDAELELLLADLVLSGARLAPV